jgi:transaldolase
VVNTMPEATLRAVADHGRIPADSVRGHHSDARQVLSELEALGVDYGDVTQGWRATAWPPSTSAGGSWATR